MAGGGAIDVVSRDGLHHEAAITRLGVGQFSGEVNQLAGRGTLTAGRAGPLSEMPLMRGIERSNGLDCRAMAEVLDPLRREH